MSTLDLRGPINIQVVLALTLPSISEEEINRIQAAAPPGSTVSVVSSVRQAVAQAGNVDVILGIIPEVLFDAAPKLKWVHAIASGMDAMLYPKMRDSSVLLSGEKGLVGGHLADTGFGLLLALTRQIKTALSLGPDGWNHRPAMRTKEVELEGMTMGVIGFGGTGRAMARRAVAFGMNVIAVDAMAVPGSDGVDDVWTMDRLPELLGTSDVVAIGAPLTPETRNLIDDAAFSRMKRGALIVNVTRGEIIDGDALVAALRDGRCGGAALDVAPIEPLPADHPLWTFDNVVMTPHTAGASQLRGPRNIARFCENLRRAQAGEHLIGLVDKQSGF
ncbi:MAG: D-2-hydroxyacid dehydrogenase [Gammaproteobacteria bacterium]|nr:D-2-hydroxyacid dehydrogenase [Gammaproteobacteria bacterium]